MAAFKTKLEFLQGEDFLKSFTWKLGPVNSATPVNLTGYTARAQLREKLDSETVLLDLTTENGRIVLGGAAGTITLQVTAAVTAAMTWRSAVFDLEMVAGDGKIRRLISGTATVSPEVTRV
jgi:hypothetical protein